MSGSKVEVTGLRELRKSLKGFETDTSWRPALRGAYSMVAQPTAAAIIAASTTTHLGSRGRGTIVGKATTTAARIDAFRGIAYGAGFNFGSSGRYRQFPPRADPDHFLFSTIARRRPQITQEFLDAIDKAFDREGL